MVCLAKVGKEQEVAVTRGGKEAGDKVFLFRVEVDNPHTSPLLMFILLWVGALYIAACSQDHHLLLVGHQVLYINNSCSAFNYFCRAVVAILLNHILDLAFNNGHHFFVRFEERIELSDECLDLQKLLLNFAALEVGKLLQSHLEDGMCLELGEGELLHQIEARIVHIL